MALDPRLEMSARWLQCLDFLKEASVFLSYREFSEKTGIPQQSITDIKAGRRNVTLDMMKTTRDVYFVNPDYVLSGAGTMFIDGDIPDIVRLFRIEEGITVPPFNEEVAKRLRIARKATGLSQAQACEAGAIPQKSLALWESGASMPSLADLVLLASFYAVSTDYLLTGMDSNPYNRSVATADQETIQSTSSNSEYVATTQLQEIMQQMKKVRADLDDIKESQELAKVYRISTNHPGHRKLSDRLSITEEEARELVLSGKIRSKYVGPDSERARRNGVSYLVSEQAVREFLQDDK